MRLEPIAVALFALCALCYSQRPAPTINAETPEGQLLQKIGQESSEPAKLALLEEFAAKNPAHEAAAWVYAQMIPLYAKASQFDKALDAGEKLLEADPTDARSAHEALKAAEGKNDAETIRIWALRTSNVARKVAAEPKPTDEAEVERWTHRTDFARQLDVYTEYALYNAALKAADPRQKIALAEALEQQNPQSQYLPQVAGHQFLAYQQAGDKAKAAALAERVLEKDQSNEDMLLAAADYAMNSRQPDKVLNYSSKLVALMSGKPAPSGVPAEEWEKKKRLTLGLAHWMSGITYSEQKKLAQADKSLRDSLPFIEDNPQLLAPALFHLGLVNFQLGDAGKGNQQRVLEAYKYTQRCAAMNSPYQAQAKKNLAAMRSKYAIK